ncbi:MAG: choice-of-anchor D domain-containing protein, partial [bacterium]
IYAQRIDADGSIYVGWTPDGEEICTATGYQYEPQIASDGAEGAIITWRDWRSGNNDIYAQRIDASGVVQWTTDGEAVGTAGASYNIQIVSDGAGGAIITWEDIRSGAGNPDIYAQRIDADGSTHVGWTPDGEEICTDTGYQNEPQIASDGAGGAIITWEDSRSGNSDVYAQRIDASGTGQYVPSGTAICTAIGEQNYCQIISAGIGIAIITWEDNRDSENTSIYAQSITDPICDVQPTEIDFGTNVLGFKDSVFTISNTGDASFSGSVSESCEYYSIVSGEGPFTLARDEFIDVTVRFEPYYEGTQTCTISTGYPNCSTVSCTGHGQGPVCEVIPTSLSFPAPVQVGDTSDAFFIITNIGSGVLIGNISEVCEPFRIFSGGGPFTLLSDDTITVTIRFEPTSAGMHQCDIETGVFLCSDVSITGTAYSCYPGRLYVDADVSGGTGDGSSWGDAFTELRNALVRVSECPGITEIWVASGTYTPTDTEDRSATFALQNNLALYGGFAGWESELSERDITANPTVLSGDIDTLGYSGDNSYHVVTASGTDSTAILDGFIVSGGYDYGGDGAGGGIYNLFGSPIIANVIVSGNYVSNLGGGMFNWYGDAKLVNVIFSGNSAGNVGGGMGNMNSSPNLVNVTFSGNTAVNSGGGMANMTSGNPSLANSIIWGNSSPSISNSTADPYISHSLVEGSGGSASWNSSFGIDLGGNIDADPLFVDVAGGNLRLLDGSPAVDAGDNSAPNLPVTDIAGQPRIQNGTVDMGAYEGGVLAVQVTVASEPTGISVEVNDTSFVSPKVFDTYSSMHYRIGVTTPQQQGDTLYSFMNWSDGGDTTHMVVIPDTNVTYTATFSYLFEYAMIDSIVDVPDDQGGWVRIYFTRSHYDNPLEVTYPIFRYDIHRRVDNPAIAAGILADGKPLTDDKNITLKDGSEILFHASSSNDGLQYLEYGGKYYMVSDNDMLAAPPGIWEVAGTVSAQQQPYYISLVPTLGDSIADPPLWSFYYISAHSTTPAVYFDSPVDSGYSVDNIAPGVPLGFAVAYNTGSGNQLTWDSSPEPDFQYYRIYRGDTEDFPPGPGNLVHETATESWSDPEYDGWDVHYKITALDYAGNESDAASPGSTTGDEVPSVPKAFALYQNAPNPFNPTTTIRFDLPRAVHVKLSVYNVKGELIATLVNQSMTEGRKEVAWSAKDNKGRAVSSGIYFYRLVAGDFVQTKKMVLLR